MSKKVAKPTKTGDSSNPLMELISQTTGSKNPLQSAQYLIQAYQNYNQVKETEKTKRTEIVEYSRIEIERIRSQAETIRDYFAKSFAERRSNFDKVFTMLDAGLTSGNGQQVEVALSLIVSMIKESPLRQAAEVMQQIKNRKPGETIDI